MESEKEKAKRDALGDLASPDESMAKAVQSLTHEDKVKLMSRPCSGFIHVLVAVGWGTYCLIGFW